MPETIQWIDPDGTAYTISPRQADIQTLMDIKGRFMPPVDFIEDDVPQQPGSRLRDTRIRPREVDLAVLLKGSTASELRANYRAWLHRLNSTRGDGRLRITAPDGSQRELICRYSTGMQGSETPDTTGVYWQKALFVLRAVDPFWYSVSPTVASYAPGTPAPFFPFFPLRLATAGVFAVASIDNGGDVETWPVWIISGPCTSLTLTNQTTGKVLALTATLLAGETVTIDTRPAHKTVVKTAVGGATSNLFSSLSNTSALWELIRGVNSIKVEMTDTTAESLAQVSYYERYLGA
jgi:hypothetical protein